MKYVKNQIYKTHYFSSTIPKGTMASLGTIEADACSYYGSHDEKSFNGEKSLNKIIKNLNFNTVLDVGSGEGKQKNFFCSNGKIVKTCDYDLLQAPHSDNLSQNYDYVGNFLDLKIEKKFDFVFSSHVLEHQRNVGEFLEKKINCTKEGGFICTVVPIRKPFITGGHCTLWNPGLLLYNFVLCGIDCSECYLEQIDYDICLVVKNKKFDIEQIDLCYDRGDVDKLMKFFPFDAPEPFNGDIMYVNTLWSNND